ncbi:Translation elongation factor 1 beta [Agyrium rufum]|nr:Translation elongation factor 1 beta [Agyrium rufum]
MGFTDFMTDAGMKMLESWLTTRSYIVGFIPSPLRRRVATTGEINADYNPLFFLHSYAPSQADVKSFETLKAAPAVEHYPHAWRWYKHIASYQSDFSSLPGDPSKSYQTYGPEITEAAATNPSKAPAKVEDEEEDDDLFGSDEEEEDAETVKQREANLAAYKAKKSLKEKPAAKSIVTLDVKPWDDETDMKELEANLRAISMDGLVWGGGKLVPVGFGIKKLQVNVVIEDDKVSLDDLQAQIESDEDHVQSTDVAAMQKL